MTGIEEGLDARAHEFLAAAKTNFDAGHLNVAFEEARTAAELAAKLLLFRATGERPRDHNPTGRLQQLRILPPGVSPKDLSGLLGQATRGAYGFNEPVSVQDASHAIRLAAKMVSAI